MIPQNIPLKNIELFNLATHHSSAVENSIRDSYERLEYFGDAILDFVIAEYLYEHYPTWDQGVMSKARSSVVQEAPLAEAAKRLGLEEHIKLSSGERSFDGGVRASILADVFEAIVGAIYLESGLSKTRWFLLEQLHTPLMQIASGDVNPFDYKSKLQEITQSMWRKSPRYEVFQEEGTAHNKTFYINAILDDEILGEGSGRSKKEAEQSAAKDAIETIERSKSVDQ
jgi:ribonuclease-3